MTPKDYKPVLRLAKEKGYKQFHEISRLLEAPYKYEKLLFMELCLVQKWLRDEHKIDVSVSFKSYSLDKPAFIAQVKSLSSKNMGEVLVNGFVVYHPKYEQALLEGVSEALKLISEYSITNPIS